MNKRVFLFRHGQPEERFQQCCRGGESDCALSNDGMRQTAANVAFLRARLGEALACALVVTTGMRRTDAFGKMLDGSVAGCMADADLKAVRAGAWEGLPWTAIEELWPQQYRLCVTDAERLTIPGGESMETFADRVIAGWRQVMRSAASEVIVVSHNCTNAVIWGTFVEPGAPWNFRGQPIGSMHELCVHDSGVIEPVQRNIVLY